MKWHLYFRWPHFRNYLFIHSVKILFAELKKWKGREGNGREGRRNRIARRINVVPGGEFSPIYFGVVEGGMGEKTRSICSNHDIH